MASRTRVEGSGTDAVPAVSKGPIVKFATLPMLRLPCTIEPAVSVPPLTVSTPEPIIDVIFPPLVISVVPRLFKTFCVIEVTLKFPDKTSVVPLPSIVPNSCIPPSSWKVALFTIDEAISICPVELNISVPSLMVVPPV